MRTKTKALAASALAVGLLGFVTWHITRAGDPLNSPLKDMNVARVNLWKIVGRELEE